MIDAPASYWAIMFFGSLVLCVPLLCFFGLLTIMNENWTEISVFNKHVIVMIPLILTMFQHLEAIAFFFFGEVTKILYFCSIFLFVLVWDTPLTPSFIIYLQAKLYGYDYSVFKEVRHLPCHEIEAAMEQVIK